MADGTNDFNTKIIEEFRANDGKVGPPFEGAPLLLLHSTGARSGQERVNPVMYQAVGDDLAVFAPRAGRPPIRTGTTTWSPTPGPGSRWHRSGFLAHLVGMIAPAANYRGAL